MCVFETVYLPTFQQKQSVTQGQFFVNGVIQVCTARFLFIRLVDIPGSLLRFYLLKAGKILS